MLYLIQSAGYDDAGGYIDLLKIGYAESISSRMTGYKLHNPTCKLLKTIKGDLIDETKVQNHFSKYRFVGYGKEWFVYSKEIVDFFSSDPDLSLLSDTSSVSSVKKRLSGFIEKIVGVYFLDNVFSESSPEFKELDRMLKDVKPLEALIGNVIRTELDAIEEVSKVLKIDQKSLEIPKRKTKIKKVDEILDKIRATGKFPERMRLVCMSGLDADDQRRLLRQLPIKFSRIFYLFGPEKCARYSYREGFIDREMANDKNNTDLAEILANKIFEAFPVGSRIKKSDIKEKLREIYASIGYSAAPKATDLDRFFDLKECKITICGEVSKGFRIIRRK